MCKKRGQDDFKVVSGYNNSPAVSFRPVHMGVQIPGNNTS